MSDDNGPWPLHDRDAEWRHIVQFTTDNIIEAAHRAHWFFQRALDDPRLGDMPDIVITSEYMDEERTQATGRFTTIVEWKTAP